jgi:hypothetical protein
VPEKASDCVACAIDRDPEQRYQSMADFAAALSDVLVALEG